MELQRTAPFTTDALADFLIGRFNSLTQGIGEYKGTRDETIQRICSGFLEGVAKIDAGSGCAMGAVHSIQ